MGSPELVFAADRSDVRCESGTLLRIKRPVVTVLRRPALPILYFPQTRSPDSACSALSRLDGIPGHPRRAALSCTPGCLVCRSQANSRQFFLSERHLRSYGQEVCFFARCACIAWCARPLLAAARTHEFERQSGLGRRTYLVQKNRKWSLERSARGFSGLHYGWLQAAGPSP